jgi:hypothetical protein
MVLVFARPSCSMTADIRTGIVPHGVPCTVVGAENGRIVACCSAAAGMADNAMKA